MPGRAALRDCFILGPERSLACLSGRGFPERVRVFERGEDASVVLDLAGARLT
ncbi:MAG TPA: hypothetical protein PKA95_17750 [Thermomicrobiales bacterium]|nr:hypothetical protein [Thermomicrobiales bacterium]